VGFFAGRARTASPARPGTRADLSASRRAALPPRFEAVGEALATGTGTVDACTVAGQQLAADGLSLPEALDALHDAAAIVLEAEPGFAETRALAQGWSEATLGYLHHLSCEDPVTGLASLAHLQARVAELYRPAPGEGAAHERHALVVVDPDPAGQVAPLVDVLPGGTDVLGRDLATARRAEALRAVFTGPETLARVGRDRIVVLTVRDERLAQRVRLVRRLLGGAEEVVVSPRVWVEGLPPVAEGAALTIADLARA
jgi:GGDEF domain-containing protein